MEPPKRKRLVVCRGVYCNAGRRADHNFEKLRPHLDELNGDAYPPPIKVEIASCLSMCGIGPNLIIYPDKIVCNGVDEDQVEQIVNDYLKE